MVPQGETNLGTFSAQMSLTCTQVFTDAHFCC